MGELLRRRAMMAAVSQSPTPTPVLPAEYQEVEYIIRPSGSGNIGYNSFYVQPNGTDELEIRVGFMSAPVQEQTYGYPVGIRATASGDTVGFGVNVNNSITSIGVFAGGNVCSISPNNGASIAEIRYDIIAKRKTNEISITDGTNSNSLSLTPRTMAGSLAIFGVIMGSYANHIEYGFRGRIYYATIIEGGVVKANFVPCRRLSDNAPGWYDTVQEAFRTASRYIAGPDVN